MPVTTEIFTERNLMIHHFSGYISLPFIINSLKSISADPQYRPGMSMVWHCEMGATIDTNADVPQIVSDFARKIFDQNGLSYKAALVAADDLPFGMFRAYEGWSNDRPLVDIQVFRHLEDAMAWVET